MTDAELIDRIAGLIDIAEVTPYGDAELKKRITPLLSVRADPKKPPAHLLLDFAEKIEDSALQQQAHILVGMLGYFASGVDRDGNLRENLQGDRHGTRSEAAGKARIIVQRLREHVATQNVVKADAPAISGRSEPSPTAEDKTIRAGVPRFIHAPNHRDVDKRDLAAAINNADAEPNDKRSDNDIAVETFPNKSRKDALKMLDAIKTYEKRRAGRMSAQTSEKRKRQ